MTETPANQSEPSRETSIDDALACQASGAAPETAADNAPLPSEEEIREALKEVLDPEIGINIVDLGLIYDVIRNPEQATVQVNMTLTSPGCPLGPEISSAVFVTVTRMPGVKDCNVEMVWSPMWDPMERATEEARMALGIW